MIDHLSGRIKRSFQPDVEVPLLSSRTVVGKIQAVFDDRVEVDRPTLAGIFARMLGIADMRRTSRNVCF
jgi:hypothetical protein